MKINLKKNITKYSKNKSSVKENKISSLYPYIKKAKLHFRKENVILLLFLLIAFIVILFPISMIIIRSFYENHTFSIKAYREAFSSPGTYKAIINTLKLSCGVLVFAILIGGLLAFLCEKTDIKCKKVIRFFVFLSFTIPSYILSISWIEITTRGGYLNRLLEHIMPNIDYNFNCYSLLASVIVLSIHLYPLAFYGISNALRKTGGILEKSGRLSGASPMYVSKTIIFPLVLPSIFSIGLLIISRSMANFGVVAQLSLPMGIEVLTTRIYGAISELNLPLVNTLSILLMLISYIIFIVTERIIKKRNYYLNEDYNNKNNELIKLKKANWSIYMLIVVFFSATLVIPLITLIISSFLKRWGLDINISNMTLNNYKIALLRNHAIKKSFMNSLSYGIFSATIACVIGSFVVYYYNYVKCKKTNLLMNICQLPISIPNMVLAIGAIFTWINKPFRLYGTKWIIIITYISLFIPIVLKQVNGLAKNIDNNMDMSARTLGVPIIRRITKLFIPQIQKGLASGWILCFLIALREIPISLLLYADGTETIGVMLFTVQSNSYGLEMTSTISILVIIISIILNIVVNKIGVRRVNS
jgi:iron(III) transport system permease protein